MSNALVSHKEALKFQHPDNAADFYYAMAWRNYEHYAAWYMLGNAHPLTLCKPVQVVKYLKSNT